MFENQETVIAQVKPELTGLDLGVDSRNIHYAVK